MDAASGKTGKAVARLVAIAGCVLALGVSGCQREGASSRPPQPGDTAVAMVDGQAVWASDVKREAVALGLIGQGEPLDVTSPLFHQALDELVDQKLLAAEALKHGLDKDPEVLRRIAAARERILGDMLVETMVERTVSESAIRGLYNDEVNAAGQAAAELHAAQIVTASQADADAVRKALAGGAPFDQLAMQRSTDSATRLNGGDLGYFTVDVMPAPYADALKAAKVGDIVGPFQTDAGWVVMKLEDSRPEAPISLEAARPQIVNFLTYEGVRDLLKKLHHDNQIKLLIGPAAQPATTEQEPASAPVGPPPQTVSSQSAAAPAPVASAAPVSAQPPAVASSAPPAPQPRRIAHAPPPARPRAVYTPHPLSLPPAPQNQTP